MSRLTRWLLGHAWLARAIVVVGILGTAASAYVSHTEVEFETHAIFEKFAGDIPGDIEASVRAYSDLLYSLRGLFNSSGHVSREDFHRFVAALELKERYPGLTNLSYAFRVQHADRQRFEQSVRGEVTPLTGGLPEFRIRPSAERPEYHVLTYIEPLAENAIAHGLDLGSDPQRLSIVENARDSGTVSTTVGLTLLRDSGTQHQSVLMRLAVYRTGHVPASVELRREQYVGLAGVALRLNELMSSLALKFPRLKDVRIVIRDYIEGEGLGPVLYDSLHPQHTTVPQVMPGRIWISQPIHAGDRQWHLSVTPLENPLSPEYAALPYLVALAGLCLTFLVYALVKLLAVSERRAQALNLVAEHEHASNALGDALQVCLTMQEAYEVIRIHAPLILPGTHGALYQSARDSRSAELALKWGAPHELPASIRPEDCLAMRGGRIRCVHDSAGDLNCRHFEHAAPKAYACVPLLAHGQAIGLLHLQAADPSGDCDDAMLAKITALCDRIALALANLQLRETLSEQATRDKLTGLYNRHYLQDWLARELHRSERHKHPLGVIMIDIDHFKRCNDTFGHDAGDHVLREMSRLLRSGVRNSDVVCRFGGEEFIILLPETDLEQAMQQAKRLRHSVKQLELTHAGRSIGSITISAGVAAYPLHGKDGDAVLKCADTALYAAKSGGRDRVVVFQEPSGIAARPDVSCAEMRPAA